jgi:hypothetical protein
MTRRPATHTQADLARAARAAKSLGPGWCVEVQGEVIRIIHIQAPPPNMPSVPDDDDQEPYLARGLDTAP